MVGDIPIELIHTPGHTPGSQCFLVDGRLVAGDTLFLEGCGRTDLPGGDPEALYESLTQRLAKVPDDAVLFPGHLYSPEPSATMGETRSQELRVPHPDHRAVERVHGRLERPAAGHRSRVFRSSITSSAFNFARSDRRKVVRDWVLAGASGWVVRRHVEEGAIRGKGASTSPPNAGRRGPPGQPPFDRARKGYEPAQVDAYLGRLERERADLGRCVVSP